MKRMIKNLTLLMMVLVVLAVPVAAQQKIENLILITTDGLRWQELYQGMDTVLANDKAFNQGGSRLETITYFAKEIHCF